MDGTTMNGSEYEIPIARGVTFRAYDIAGAERMEVCVEDGVITVRMPQPEELTVWQARALAAMLLEAADELEVMDAEAIRACCAA